MAADWTCGDCEHAWSGDTPDRCPECGSPAVLIVLPNPPRFRHACPDWDGAIIDDSMPEFDVCLCFGR
jgi:hypothetical protein